MLYNDKILTGLLRKIKMVQSHTYTSTYFSFRVKCKDDMASPGRFFDCGKEAELITGGKERIIKVISSSIERNDTYHTELEQQLNSNPDFTITFHKACISTYTSSHHIKRYLKRMNSNERQSDEPPLKLRSNHSDFRFKQHCLICGKDCLPVDKKNPGRWRKVVTCRTKEKKKDLLAVCSKRGDKLAEAVHVRINGAVSDLHAADAQYHYDCHQMFVGKRNIAYAASKPDKQETHPFDIAFQTVIDALQSDETKMWNSIEIYDLFCSFLSSISGPDPCVYNSDAECRCDRASLIRQLEDHFGDRLTVLRVHGCASLVCFRTHLPSNLKLVSANDNDDVSELAKKISAEVKTSHTRKSEEIYDLNDFNYDTIERACNSNLLFFISSLISKGAVTKKSLCLTQSIQALITGSFNQTTLGLAVKLHHRFGSREIIELLHSHGYVTSYDEVRRYRKSAAKMTAEHDFTFRGLVNDGGLISSWCDNFDLQVYTPNGCRETHAMAVEFTQNVKGKITSPPPNSLRLYLK